MDAERYRRASESLDQALSLGPSEREGFLVELGVEDPELRAEVESLLAAAAGLSDDFLETPGADRLTRGDVLAAASDSSAPESIGGYTILETLGRGGMGVVYLAEQQEPVERKLALKVLERITGATERERFAREGQALARMQHPNVAALYQVGETEAGEPFVAMEWIEGGERLIDWCNARRLDLDERLRLFIGVCHGIGHAHEKGVLHRDIKPANVLVAEIDGTPQAKVIDFGIACTMDEDGLGDSRITRDRIIGSPAYMSPEAASGSRDVDTRSDVYSSGLLLYELLAGTLPFDPDESSIETLVKRRKDTDYARPSRQYDALDAARREEIARARAVSPSALHWALAGDLDAVVMKAIAHERRERYGSPAEIAVDIQRHLSDTPITARPQTSSYLLRRFIRRNRTMVGAVSMVMVLLVAGIVAVSGQARRANREAAKATAAAEEAQQTSAFLVDLFEIADPERGPDTPVTARELLDRSSERLTTELTDQPLLRASLLLTIADIYTKQGLHEQALAHAQESLAIRERELPLGAEETVRSLNQIGIIQRWMGQFDESLKTLRRVLEEVRSAEPPDPELLAVAHNNLGNTLLRVRRAEEAAEQHRLALGIREQFYGPDHLRGFVEPDQPGCGATEPGRVRGGGRCHPTWHRAAARGARQRSPEHECVAQPVVDRATREDVARCGGPPTRGHPSASNRVRGRTLARLAWRDIPRETSPRNGAGGRGRHRGRASAEVV